MQPAYLCCFIVCTILDSSDMFLKKKNACVIAEENPEPLESPVVRKNSFLHQPDSILVRRTQTLAKLCSNQKKCSLYFISHNFILSPRN